MGPADRVCPLQLRQLELRLEQEHEEKRAALHEKQDLEGLVATLCEQVRGTRGGYEGTWSPPLCSAGHTGQPWMVRQGWLRPPPLPVPSVHACCPPQDTQASKPQVLGVAGRRTDEATRVRAQTAVAPMG